MVAVLEGQLQRQHGGLQQMPDEEEQNPETRQWPAPKEPDPECERSSP
jgi:hypothetical protein